MQGLVDNRLEVGTGRTAISANWTFFGEDLLIILHGEGAHIGGCSLAEPYASTTAQTASVSSISRRGHQDSEITRIIARRVSKRLGVVVAVVGGIHINDATQEEINLFLENARLLGDNLESHPH